MTRWARIFRQDAVSRAFHLHFVSTLSQVVKWWSLPAEELHSMAPVQSDCVDAVPVDIVIRRLPTGDRTAVLGEQSVWSLLTEELCRQARHRSAPASQRPVRGV